MTLRTAALVPVAVLLIGGCGGSSPSTKADATSSPTASSTTAATPGGSSAKPAAGAIASPPKGAAGASSGPTAAASSSASSAQARTAFTAPGTYTYDSHGTFTAGTPSKVDGTAELTVDKPSGDKQHSALDGAQASTEQDVVHLGSGTYLARLLLKIGGQNKEFRPAKPVLGHPRPASIGRSWSWTMTSTDGKTHASYAAKVVQRETVTIGGTKVATWVIDSTLKLTGDLTFSDHESTWYDETRLLQVKTHSQGSGSFGGIAFTTDTTSTLRSVTPS